MFERFSRLRHRNDPSVQAELNWTDHADHLPVGLDMQWLGTAGFAISYEDTTILIDPFVTRRDMWTTLRSKSLLSDAALVDRLVPAADAVLVGHTHFDHAVDVPTLAAKGCAVYGSASMKHLLGLHALGEKAVVVEPNKTYEIGPFTLSFTPSQHSKLLMGLKVPADGELTCDSLDHLGSNDYRCGQTWGITIEVAGQTLYHQGSANLIDDEIRTRDVDLFLCGIAGRMFTRDYTERIVRALRPKVVLAHHHDDFFRPVDAPMGFSFNVNLGSFAEEIESIDSDISLRTLEPLQSVGSAG